MVSEKPTEGFGGEVVGEWDRLVMGSKEGTYCTVHWVLYATNEASNFASNPGMYCMVTNIIKNHKKKERKTNDVPYGD